MQDLYQIVDEQDNLIGAKPRNEINFKNDYYRISGLWLTNSKGQILIAQRLLTKDKDPGKWGPAAAGTLEVGETYESNAYKEAEEEIGLTGVEFTLGPKMKFTTPRHSFCQWYTAVCDKSESEFTPQPTEVEQVKWIDEDVFFEDVRTNPDRYLPTMSLIIEALYPIPTLTLVSMGVAYNRDMRLYFVRHGETDVNSGLQQAHTAQFDEPLNIAGIAQAEQLAEQLRDVTFDAIISSPLRRTVQTAKIINIFHDLDVKTDDVWRELKTDVYLDATSWHEAFDFDRNEDIEGVEPIRDFFERIYMALDSLKATYGKADSVLVVSSGGVHQAVHAYVNGLPLAGNMRLSPMKNCEIREYEL